MLALVDRFRQLEARQIQACLFGEVSDQPFKRCMRRLVEGKYLARIERMVGGWRGGSGQYVYQLGRAGWKHVARDGSYWRYQVANRHMLAIAGVYVELLLATRAGALSLTKFITEPECHREIGGISLTPDAYMELSVNGVELAYWLEVDMGSERASQLADKCRRYWHAFQRRPKEGFPLILFAVPDDDRERYVKQVVRGGPTEAHRLFRTTNLNSVARVVLAEQI